MLPPVLFLILGALSLLCYGAYKQCLPRPIPGIPYNEEATKSILGDLPALIKYTRETGEKMSWLPLQAQKLNSPIIQIFARPLAKPWIIISDFRESQDILIRRTKDFDRSDRFGDIFRGLTPEHHVTMKSADPRFKIHRKLVQDLMTPAFLNEVSAPRIYSAFTSLLELWTQKARLAEGRPFSAAEDFYHAALDAIWAVTFPLDMKNSAINAQLQHLLCMASVVNPPAGGKDEPVAFPEAPVPPAQKSILTLTESIEMMVMSPAPKLLFRFLKMLPYMRKANSIKEGMITSELAKAVIKHKEGQDEEKVAGCAMDYILYRELSAAKKDNREPILNTRAIYDELFGLLVAGHDTTSTTVVWGLKLLTDHPEVQKKLRDAVRSNFAPAVSENRRPTAQEIAKASIPYLDATREEIIRKSMTAAGITRTALRDTVIFGHHIPKGTTVFLMGNGPDYVLPPVGRIAEERRSESCRGAKARIGSWDVTDSHLFKPERWLGMEDGREIFNPTAGPLLTFGLGPRGCFGRRMAYLEMNIMLVLLVWEFKLQNMPEDLSSYHAADKLTHQPRQCYLRLEKLENSI
ncbi:cytochrome P450 [Aspergillus granulosus]|uniref:Cytochrome P450 n=1 Tax=Aspergillus granulosus TaxID=176169 RepID=A0ABR4H6Q5_9EURO